MFLSEPKPGLIGAADAPGIMAVSFDVFDTVVTRHVGEPSAIFLLTGRRLRDMGLIGCGPQVFARHRYTCERRVRRNKVGREVTLREVYEEMANYMGMGDRLDQIMDVERAVERESIGVIPAMLPVVARARERFGRVIFTSDMYLSAAYLTGLLRDLGLFHENDRLYVSSAYGVQKGDGRLFQIVLKEEGLRPKELLHYGNSLPYDVLPARKLGIPVIHFDEGNPHPSEQVLNTHAMQSEGMTAIVAGAARRARLSGLGLDGHHRAIWESGTSVTGPLVYFYALWIIHRARQKGVQRLLFLARDAYLPYIAVRSILEEHPELNMRAGYLYGSRQTYYSLSVERLGEAEWEHLTTHQGHQYTTLHELQRCLMAQRSTILRHLNALGLSDADWNRRLTSPELDRFRSAALADGPFNGDLLADIKRSQQLQARHFEAEGLEPGVPAALIDTGWTSRSHAPLFNFLIARGHTDLRMFYMGLVVNESMIPLDRLDTFLFNQAAGQGVRRHGFNYPRPMEELLASEHGRTQGFDEQDGKPVPIFAELENPEFVNTYFKTYREGFMAFIRQMKGQPIAIDACHDLGEVTERLIYRFWSEPTKAEAALWSQLSWEWDPLGEVKYPLSRPYRLADTWRAFLQKKAPDCHAQFWVGAAGQLTSKPVLLALRGAINCRRAIDRALRCVPGPIRDPLSRLRRRVVRLNYQPGM